MSGTDYQSMDLGVASSLVIGVVLVCMSDRIIMTTGRLTESDQEHLVEVIP